MNLINWKAHSTCIRKLSHPKKRCIRRFIHHRLPTGKMQFLNRSRCPNCDTMFNNETHHGHVLTCVQNCAQKTYKTTILNKHIKHTTHSPITPRPHHHSNKKLLQRWINRWWRSRKNQNTSDEHKYYQPNSNPNTTTNNKKKQTPQN